MSEMPCMERIRFVMQRVYDRRRRFEYAKQVVAALSDHEQTELACGILGLSIEQLAEMVSAARERESA